MFVLINTKCIIDSWESCVLRCKTRGVENSISGYTKGGVRTSRHAGLPVRVIIALIMMIYQEERLASILNHSRYQSHSIPPQAPSMIYAPNSAFSSPLVGRAFDCKPFLL